MQINKSKNKKSVRSGDSRVPSWLTFVSWKLRCKMNLKIVSCNMCGLGDKMKRGKIFMYCKDKRFDIVLIQETHSIAKTNKFWRSEWGGEINFSNGESNARGVAICIK